MKWVLLNMKGNRGVFHGMGTRQKGIELRESKEKLALERERTFCLTKYMYFESLP